MSGEGVFTEVSFSTSSRWTVPRQSPVSKHSSRLLPDLLPVPGQESAPLISSSDIFKESRVDYHLMNLDSIFLPVPLVSKVCPSDVYRVWKSGSCLRVDTTLLGFEHMTWLKGRRSYIFKGEGGTDTDSCCCLALVPVSDVPLISLSLQTMVLW